jgi:hypothetical protein
MTSSLAARRKHETNEELVLAELRRLLRQKQFAGAPQLSAFLRYIVTEALEGRAHAIKAYSVGVDALGKPDTFDAQNDPSVRVLALRLRKALAAIYSSDQIPCAVVELKVGSYVPEFYSVGEKADVKTADSTSQQRAHSTAASALSKRAGNVETKTHPVSTAGVTQNIDVVNRVSTQSDMSANGMAVVPRNPLASLVFMFIVVILICSLFVLEKSGAGFLSSWLDSADESMPVAYAALHRVTPGANAPSNEVNSWPTIMLMNWSDPTSRAGDASVLLSSELLQESRLQLSRSHHAIKPSVFAENDYTILLDEYVVDGNLRIEVQLLAADTGAILFSSSMFFDESTVGFSNSEIQQLEQLAKLFNGPAGPLFEDYCDNEKRNLSGPCGLHNDDNRLAEYIPLGDL